MRNLTFGLLATVMLGLAAQTGASAAPLAAGAPASAGTSPVLQAAWVTRCHTVWVRRHRHHHHGWRRVPVRSCHRVHI